MITRRFQWVESPDTGLEGWLLRGSPSGFDPGDSLQVAHDCFEHMDYTGTLESELMAFGALLYIRGGDCANYWAMQGARNVDPAPIMSSDLCRFLAERDCQVKLRNTHRFTPLEDESDEEVISRLPHLILRGLREEFEVFGCKPSYFETRQALRMTQHWLRHGYRRAARRWKMHRADVCELFIAVQADVERVTHSLDCPELSTLVVRLDPTRPYHEVFISEGEYDAA